MKAYKLVLLALDFENYGAEQISMIAANARGLDPTVMAIEERDIGEWSDEHPLNHRATAAAEFDRLFGAASPVQGGASASEDNRYDCPGDVRFVATSSASGAKGAAVKPWEDRFETSASLRTRRMIAAAKDAEIADWRALADRLPAVQPVAGQAALVEAKSGIEAMLLHFTATPSTLADSIARGHGHKAIGAINRILAATPAPEQEAAQVGAKTDERAEFEAAKRVLVQSLTGMYIESFDKNPDGTYSTEHFEQQFKGWQLARSAAPAEQEAAPVAPPGAQEAVYQLRQHGAFAGWVDCERETEKRFIKSKTEHLYEFRTLYTAPSTDIIMEAAQFQMLEFSAKQGGFDSALHAVLTALTAPVPATTPAEQPEATADTLRAIRDEITGYYRALDSRQHGGVAQNKAFMAIESALGMCWEAHRATATNTNQPEGAKKCWSCKREYTEEQRTQADGDCPHCGVEIENLGAANTNKGGEA